MHHYNYECAASGEAKFLCMWSPLRQIQLGGLSFPFADKLKATSGVLAMIVAKWNPNILCNNGIITT